MLETSGPVPRRLGAGEVDEVVELREIAGVLGVEDERGGHVVVQVLADAGQVVDDLDADLAQVGRGADAGQHQQLGRVDGATGQDHLGVGVRPSCPRRRPGR